MNVRGRWRRGAVWFGLLAALLAVAPAAWGQNQPVDDRAMGFRPGLGERRETVPGGRLLVAAYAVTLVLLGGYVAVIARKAGRIDEEVRRLEDDLERRRPRAGDA